MALNYPDGTSKNSRQRCPICLEMYRDARSLTRSHTFCQRCSNKYALKQNTDCPLKESIDGTLYRKTQYTNSSDAPHEKWEKALHGKEEMIYDELCKVCQNKKKSTIASKYCIQCKNELCDDCENIHALFEQFKSHNMIDIGDKMKLETISEELDLCSIHGKLIEFYCVDENNLCCSSCAVGRHRKCYKVTEIEDIAEEQNEEIEQSLIKKMRELTSRTRKVVRFFENMEKTLHSQIKAIDRKLIDERVEIIDMLKLSRTKIQTDAANVRSKAAVRYKFRRNQCNDITSFVAESVQQLAVVRRHGTLSQLFIALHSKERQLVEYLLKSEETFADLRYVDILAEKENIIQQILNAPSLWKLQMSEVDKLVSDIPDYWKVKLELVASVDVIALNEDEREPLYTGMVFLPDGRLIVIDNKNCRCLLMNKQLETIGSYKQKTCLYDVVSLSNTNIVVTGVKRLEQLKLNGAEFIHTETVKVKSRVFSLSEIDSENFVSGTFRSETPAKIVSMNGETKYFDITFPKAYWSKGDSMCVFDKDTGKLVVTDRFQHRVYIYDTQDNSEVIVDDDRIRGPRGISIGPYQRIFVCSSNTNSIVQLSMFGEILHTHVLDMEFPGTLCFSKCKSSFAVSNYASTKKKLHCFKVI